MAEQNTNKKKLAIKMILPILLIALVASIWIIKSNERASEEVAITPEAVVENTANKTQATTNPDFSLAASTIDLEKLKTYGLPILIDFGAETCIPCREMAPVLKKLNEEWQGKVIVKFVDISKYPDAAADFPVQVIPTQFFFDAKGKPYVPSDPEGMQMQIYTLRDTQEHVYTAHMGGMTEEQVKAVFAEMGVADD